MDHRRDRRRRVAAVAEHVGVGRCVEPVEELDAHARLDQQSGAGEADLAGVVVLAGRLARRGIEVGVGEDDEGAFAAELGGERDEVAGSGDTDRPAGLRRAGEADPPDPPVADQRCADLFTDPLHHVEHPRRDARLVRQVGEQRARQRRPFRRLEDHRVAGGQRRRALPGGEHERCVPRRDHDRRAGRHPQHPVGRAVRRPDPFGRTARRARRRRGSCAPRDRSPAAASCRSSIAMSGHSTAAIRSTLASTRSAQRRSSGARPSAPSAAQAGKASIAASTAAAAVDASPRATSASFHDQSSGERSSNVVADPTRRPPM